MPCRHAFLSDDCGIISPLQWFYLTRRSVTSQTAASLEEPGALSTSLTSADCRRFETALRYVSSAGGKRALGLGDTPILQGVLVPSAGGSGGNTSLWAPSSVPASSLSCQTGYQTGIPASNRLHLRLTCWQREREGVFCYLWVVVFLRDRLESDAKRKTYAAQYRMDGEIYSYSCSKGASQWAYCTVWRRGFGYPLICIQLNDDTCRPSTTISLCLKLLCFIKCLMGVSMGVFSMTCILLFS